MKLRDEFDNKKELSLSLLDDGDDIMLLCGDIILLTLNHEDKCIHLIKNTKERLTRNGFNSKELRYSEDGCIQVIIDE